MSDEARSTDLTLIRARVLDHSSEFVELVQRQAPGEYRSLLDSGRYRLELEQQNTFNHGKLFAYAEFVVFRREFRTRFPQASPAACITAFSGLFLKNDISISNLVDFMEGAGDREQLLLNQPR